MAKGEIFRMCTGSIPSAGAPIQLPLNQQLTQSTPRHPPQKPAMTDPMADRSAPTIDANRGKHANVAA